MIIFASIFGVGFIILAISMFFGEHDIDANADIDTDTGGPNIFSIKMVALLMVGFGAVGFGLLSTTEASMFQSSLGGVAGAVALGLIGWVIMKGFYASQASSTIQDEEVVGKPANLIDAIAQNRNGQVACIIKGREITFLARSHDGRPIARGIPVKIVGKTGNIVTVQPIDNSQI